MGLRVSIVDEAQLAINILGTLIEDGRRAAVGDMKRFPIEGLTFCPTGGRFSFQTSVREPPDPTTLSQNEGLSSATEP